MKNYFRNGKLQAVQHYLNDTLHDSTIHYHENGVPKEIQIFNRGKREGNWKKFNKNGSIYWTATFTDDYREGEALQYSYHSLKLIKRHFFKRNVMHGRQEQYYNNGKPMSITYYDNGMPLEGTVEYTESGKVIDHHTKFNVQEVDNVLLTGELTYFIGLSDPRPSDEVYVYDFKEKNGRYYVTRQLDQRGNRFVLNYEIGKGSVLMENVNLLAKRKTPSGNYVFFTHTLNVAATNY